MCDAILNFSISEGKIAKGEALSVPGNVRATAMIESAIADEDGSVAGAGTMGGQIMAANSTVFSSSNIVVRVDCAATAARATLAGALACTHTCRRNV